MSEITSTATYGVKIYANGNLVEDKDLAEYVLDLVFREQAVIRERQGDRWAISVAGHCKLADTIERKGFQKAFTRVTNGTGISWL